MQIALKLQQHWSPQVPHALGVVLTTMILTLLVTALLIITGLVVQEVMGGAPPSPLAPEPGLDL